MAITRWSPDTCGCVIDYTWDPDVPDGARTHSFHAVERICAGHDGLSDPPLFDTVLAENQTKNRLHGWAVANLARLRHPLEDRLSDGVEFRWSFTGTGAGRRLEVWLDGATLTAGEKGLMRAFAATLNTPATVR